MRDIVRAVMPIARTLEGLTAPATAMAARKESVSLAWFVAATAATAFAIFWQLGTPPLVNPDEGRNASIAWEMQQANTWFVPLYNGLPYLDKPAFFFKLSGLSLCLFGPSAFAARLPSALFAAATLALVFGFCRREYDARTAVLALAVVGTTPLYVGFARFVIFDMTLAFFVCAAIFAGYYAESAGDGRTRARWSMLSAAAIGFATLVKGPVGFVVPLLVLGVFHRVDGRPGALKRLLCGRNLLIFLAVFLPWFVGASLQRHDLPYYGIVFESIERFTTTAARRTQPFYFYLWVIPASMLCWGLLLPQTLLALWKGRTVLSRADRLLLVWAIAVTVFFSISQSKMPGYVLTAVIALGILVARRFAIAFDAPYGHFVRGGGVLLALAAAVPAASVAWYAVSPDLLDAAVRRHGSRDAETAIVLLHASAPLLALALAAVAAVALPGALQRSARVVFASYLAWPLAVIALVMPVFASVKQRGTDEPLARRIEQVAPGAAVACYRCFPPGIPFYLGRNITVFTDGKGTEIPSNYIPFTLGRASTWPEHMQRAENLEPWLAKQTQPVFLMATDSERAVLDALAAARHGTVIVLPGERGWGLLLKPGRP